MAINIKPQNRGKLHKALDVPQGSAIPAGKLEKATKSTNPALKREAVFAENAKSFSHPGKAGGAVSKVAAGPMGHPKPPTVGLETDRGKFRLKG